MGIRALMARAEQQRYLVTAATAAMAGRLIPVPAGVLVRDLDGAIIGAVGAYPAIALTTMRWRLWRASRPLPSYPRSIDVADQPGITLRSSIHRPRSAFRED
jgi:hypothetical protein